MPAYYVNEAMFALPEWGFVDRTIHRLEAPLAGGERLEITIRRSPLEESKTLRQLVDDEVSATTAQVASFAVLAETEATVSGAPAIVLRARWRTEDDVHVQAQAHLAVDGTWVAMAVTAPYADRAACEETFERALQSLVWRGA